jgi:alpha-D-glucose phosphate-specific phosphoglucomutase
MEENMAAVNYGMDGWKAYIAKDFTENSVKKVMQGIAGYIKSNNLSQRGIVVGYDNRFLSEEFAVMAAEVLLGNGIKTHLMTKAAPAPLLSFTIRKQQLGGGVMVTASHHPATMNGLRFIPEDAGPAVSSVVQIIDQYIERAFELDKYYRIDLQEAYSLNLLEDVDLEKEYVALLAKLCHGEVIKNAARPLKVVVDPMYGSTIGYLDKILTELGCEVKVVNNYRDAMFGNIVPIPEDRYLADLKRAVISYQADLGIALDGDGDNYGLISADGEMVATHEFVGLLLHYLLSTRPTRGPVCRTCASSRLLDSVARENGISVIETPVGFSYVSEAMQQKSCILGVEEMGGLTVMGHTPDKDAILAGLLAVEILAASGKSMTDLLQEIRDQYGTLAYDRLTIPSSPDKMALVQQKLEKWMPPALAGEKVVQSVFNEEGKKIILEGGSWILIRPSATTANYRIYLEADRYERLQEIRAALFEAAGFLEED